MEAAAGIGDNSKHFGEELRAELETVLGDDHEAVFRYAQWHIGDYITGTNGMNLEAEGGYIRFLMRLYQRGKPLPDDDRFMASCMNLSLRVWRRIRDALVGFGKIIARNGCLTNARFEKERIRRAEEMKKKADAANKRWQAKPGFGEVSSKLRANLGETSPKHSANIVEKTNEINGNAQNVHMLTNNQEPLTNKVKGSWSSSSSLLDAARRDERPPPAPDSISAKLTITDDEIRGPGFTLDLRACEYEIEMAGLGVNDTRMIAETVARDWVASKVTPRYPVAAFRQAVITRRNQRAVDGVRLAKGIERATQTPQSAQIDATYQRVMAKKKAREESNG